MRRLVSIPPSIERKEILLPLTPGVPSFASRLKLRLVATTTSSSRNATAFTVLVNGSRKQTTSFQFLTEKTLTKPSPPRGGLYTWAPSHPPATASQVPLEENVTPWTANRGGCCCSSCAEFSATGVNPSCTIQAAIAISVNRAIFHPPACPSVPGRKTRCKDLLQNGQLALYCAGYVTVTFGGSRKALLNSSICSTVASPPSWTQSIDGHTVARDH